MLANHHVENKSLRFANHNVFRWINSSIVFDGGIKKGSKKKNPQFCLLIGIFSFIHLYIYIAFTINKPFYTYSYKYVRKKKKKKVSNSMWLTRKSVFRKCKTILNKNRSFYYFCPTSVWEKQGIELAKLFVHIGFQPIMIITLNGNIIY